jgi:hypothetical protein
LTQGAADARYRDIQRRAGLNQPISADDQAFSQAYEKQKLLVPQFKVENRAAPSDVGTWQLMEDPSNGEQVLFNSRTAETRSAPVQKVGTFAKQQAGTNAVNYANTYLQGGNYTGPGDEALMEKFFDLAKPETGFRMNQAQQKMLKDSQNLMGSIEAWTRHKFTGVWFSDQQRRDIVQTMQDIASARVVPGGGGGLQVTDPRGVIHTFPDQKSADAFRQAAGIR